MQTFFQQRHKKVKGDGTTDLEAHRVGACAVEGLDAQMLLEPLEGQFDLPAVAR